MDVKQTFPGIETNIGMSDMLFMPYGNYMALQGIVAGFSNTIVGQKNARINGCLFTDGGTTMSVTDGYMLINKTCVKVEAQTIAFNPALYTYIRVVYRYNPIGTKIYNDGVERETCIEIRGELFQSSTNYTTNLAYYTVYKPSTGIINNITMQELVNGRTHTYTSTWNMYTQDTHTIDFSNLDLTIIKQINVTIKPIPTLFVQLPAFDTLTNIASVYIYDIDMPNKNIILFRDPASIFNAALYNNATVIVWFTYY